MISSLSLLLAQVDHDLHRLLIGAAENDILFERINPSHDLRTQSLVVWIVVRHDSDFIFPRRQILDDELPSRIDITTGLILRRLIRSARDGAEPLAGRKRAADNLH